MGNRKSNAIYNPNELRNPPPPNLEDGERDSEMEQYIRGLSDDPFFLVLAIYIHHTAKYEYRKYIDKNALVASKLGPSRSSTSMAPRSSSSSLASATSRSSTLPQTSSTPSNLGRSSLSNDTASTPAPAAPPPQPAAPVLQNPPKPQGSVPQGGVWNDLIQLQDSSSAASVTNSLPLQYQQQQSVPAQPVMATGMSQPSLYAASSVTANPTGLGYNPFHQQQFQPQLTPSSTFTSSFPFNQPMQPQSSFGQQLFMNQTGVMATPTSQQVQFFQPRPQASSSAAGGFQTQQNGFMTPSPSQGMVMSAPVGQTNFMTPSPNPLSQQYISHSPQPQQQQMFMTPSPQPQIAGMAGGGGGMLQHSHSPIPGMMGGAYMGQQIQVQTLQPQQQQQQGGQFLQGIPSQMLSPANFQASMSTQSGFSRNPFAHM